MNSAVAVAGNTGDSDISTDGDFNPPMAPVRERLSWALYDFANTVFSMNIATLYFAAWLVGDLGHSNTLYATANGIASALVVVSIPLFGAISECNTKTKAMGRRVYAHRVRLHCTDCSSRSDGLAPDRGRRCWNTSVEFVQPRCCLVRSASRFYYRQLRVSRRAAVLQCNAFGARSRRSQGTSLRHRNSLRLHRLHNWRSTDVPLFHRIIADPGSAPRSRRHRSTRCGSIDRSRRTRFHFRPDGNSFSSVLPPAGSLLPRSQCCAREEKFHGVRHSAMSGKH